MQPGVMLLARSHLAFGWLAVATPVRRDKVAEDGWGPRSGLAVVSGQPLPLPHPRQAEGSPTVFRRPRSRIASSSTGGDLATTSAGAPRRARMRHEGPLPFPGMDS